MTTEKRGIISRRVMRAIVWLLGFVTAAWLAALLDALAGWTLRLHIFTGL